MGELEQSRKIRRLRPGDEAVALELFAMMVAVFDEDASGEVLEFDYITDLLARPDFYAVAALEGNTAIGGITAHVLPMTRKRESELFIYDLAVRADRQRRGVGRALVKALLELAAAEGIATSFVAADNEDAHALSFYRSVGGDGAPVTIFTFGEIRGSGAAGPGAG